MTAPSLFDYLKNIGELNGDPNFLETEESLKGYAPFIINRGIGLQRSGVLLANEANKTGLIDKEMHYKYLFYVMRKCKNYTKWPKKGAADEDIELIQKVYKISYEKAIEYLKCLTVETLEAIRQTQNKGGVMAKNGKIKP